MTLQLTGQKFGRLIAREKVPHRPKRGFYRCDCECGNEVIVEAYKLKTGHTRSCGCLQVAVTIARNYSLSTHGELRGKLRSLEYRSWDGMKDRCYNPNATQFKNYGGRGIRICDRWRNNFAAFLEDMGRAPEGTYPSGRPHYSIDRINNDGDYEPKNCRWASHKEQMNNRRPAKEWHPKYKGRPWGYRK